LCEEPQTDVWQSASLCGNRQAAFACAVVQLHLGEGPEWRRPHGQVQDGTGEPLTHSPLFVAARGLFLFLFLFLYPFSFPFSFHNLQIRRNVGHLSGENLGSIHVVATPTRTSLGATQKPPSFMEVPNNNNNNNSGRSRRDHDDGSGTQKQPQSEVPEVVPGPHYSASSLGFRDEVMLEVTASDFFAAPPPQNAVLIELAGWLHCHLTSLLHFTFECKGSIL